jgi:hypothetical protein
MILLPNQRRFHDAIRTVTLADQLFTHFNDRQHRISTQL